MHNHVCSSIIIKRLQIYCLYSFQILDKAKLSLKDVGIEDYNFKTGELWSFSGYKKREKGAPVAFLQGFDAVELDTTLNLGTKLSLNYYLLLHVLYVHVFTWGRCLSCLA